MTSTQPETASFTAPKQTWRPSATLPALRARAAFLASVRRFFSDRGVLEVDTPVLSRAAAVDPHVESLRTADGRWLHTSPEFPMKRLLAAGCGPIYQLVHVFRAEESGRYHEVEFTLLEWYRPGFTYEELMDEVARLLIALDPAIRACTRMSYRDAFRHSAGLDPFTASLPELRRCAAAHGVKLAAPPSVEECADRDFWLDLLMGLVVAPALGQQSPAFVHDYPASQAALARLHPDDPRVAERFELFWKGVELANGWRELTDAREQRRRFERDQRERDARGQRIPPIDENLLAALEHGLPECSGVALGIDRLLMLVLGLDRIARAQSFDGERA